MHNGTTTVDDYGQNLDKLKVSSVVDCLQEGFQVLNPVSFPPVLRFFLTVLRNRNYLLLFRFRLLKSSGCVTRP
jgi:hypothetical protein